MLELTVLIPTYRRPQDLARCLEALKKQIRRADRILLVVRDTDADTQNFLEVYEADGLPLQIVNVSRPGQVAALNAGLTAAKGEILAITDDDAEPHADWLARIEAYFHSDDALGGLGGRDWVYIHEGTDLVDGRCKTVGLVQWFGRVIGNHHLGAGEPREVDILKGANMSYRRAAIANLRFDERLLGTGAQVSNDMAFSLSVKRAGWKLLYDPAVAINHYPAERFDGDDRTTFGQIAWNNRIHNETLALLEYLPTIRKIVFLIWALLVGTRTDPGLAQWLRLLPREGTLAGQKCLASMQGRWLGWQTWKQSSQFNPELDRLV